jgi:hypothetical protein
MTARLRGATMVSAGRHKITISKAGFAPTTSSSTAGQPADGARRFGADGVKLFGTF